ncbi:hypothetical protein MMC06_006013 [Schaereria dolodes]|nr:hypothetical protein [Schaereria dolodes]
MDGENPDGSYFYEGVESMDGNSSGHAQSQVWRSNSAPAIFENLTLHKYPDPDTAHDNIGPYFVDRHGRIQHKNDEVLEDADESDDQTDGSGEDFYEHSDKGSDDGLPKRSKKVNYDLVAQWDRERDLQQALDASDGSELSDAPPSDQDEGPSDIENPKAPKQQQSKPLSQHLPGLMTAGDPHYSNPSFGLVWSGTSETSFTFRDAPFETPFVANMPSELGIGQTAMKNEFEKQWKEREFQLRGDHFTSIRELQQALQEKEKVIADALKFNSQDKLLMEIRNLNNRLVKSAKEKEEEATKFQFEKTKLEAALDEHSRWQWLPIDEREKELQAQLKALKKEMEAMNNHVRMKEEVSRNLIPHARQQGFEAAEDEFKEREHDMARKQIEHDTRVQALEDELRAREELRKANEAERENLFQQALDNRVAEVKAEFQKRESDLIEEYARHQSALLEEQNNLSNSLLALNQRESAVLEEQNNLNNDRHILGQRESAFNGERSNLDNLTLVLQQRESAFNDERNSLDNLTLVLQQRESAFNDERNSLDNQTLVLQQRESAFNDERNNLDNQTLVLQQRETELIQRDSDLDKRQAQLDVMEEPAMEVDVEGGVETVAESGRRLAREERKLRDDVEELNKTVETLRRENQEQSESVRELGVRNGEYVRVIDQQKKKLQEADAIASGLRADVAEKTQLLSQAHRETRQVRTELEDRAKEVQEVATILSSTQESLRQSEANRSTSNGKIVELEKELSRAKEDGEAAMVLRHQLAERDNDTEGLKREIAGLQEEARVVEKEHDKFKKEELRKGGELKRLRARCKSLEVECKSLEVEGQRLNEGYKTLEIVGKEKLQNMEDQRNELQRSLSKTEKEIENLGRVTEELDELKKYNEVLQTQEKLRNGDLFCTDSMDEGSDAEVKPPIHRPINRKFANAMRLSRTDPVVRRNARRNLEGMKSRKALTLGVELGGLFSSKPSTPFESGPDTPTVTKTQETDLEKTATPENGDRPSGDELNKITKPHDNDQRRETVLEPSSVPDFVIGGTGDTFEARRARRRARRYKIKEGEPGYVDAPVTEDQGTQVSIETFEPRDSTSQNVKKAVETKGTQTTKDDASIRTIDTVLVHTAPAPIYTQRFQPLRSINLFLSFVLLLSVVVAIFSMASARKERNMWLAANEITRRSLLSLKAGGGSGGGLMGWLWDDPLLDLTGGLYG